MQEKSSKVIRGVCIEPHQIADLELIGKHDRRSLSFLVRDAIDLYINSRRDDLMAFKRQQSERAS